MTERGKLNSHHFNTISNHKYNIVLYIYMLIDFFYTYIGIRFFNVIEEANPLMVWLFEFDFISALGIRLIIITMIVGLVCYLKEITHKWYPLVIGFGLSLNIVVICIHLYWTSLVLIYM